MSLYSGRNVQLHRDPVCLASVLPDTRQVRCMLKASARVTRRPKAEAALTSSKALRAKVRGPPSPQPRASTCPSLRLQPHQEFWKTDSKVKDVLPKLVDRRRSKARPAVLTSHSQKTRMLRSMELNACHLLRKLSLQRCMCAIMTMVFQAIAEEFH